MAKKNLKALGKAKDIAEKDTVVPDKAPIGNNNKKSETVPITMEQAIEVIVAAGYQVVRQEDSIKTPVVPSDRLAVVIPYKKSAASGLELKYACRAWDKYFPGCKIIVIGDVEDWFSSELIHIPVSPVSSNPQLDVAMKMIVAIGADEVPERFIWSNDDILPVQPLHLADIDLLVCNGKLAVSKPGVNGQYATNKDRTLKALEAAGLPTWDYSTHTPFVFEKELLAKIIEKFKADQDGYLVSSLYFNSIHPDIKPIRITGDAKCFFSAYVYRENPPAGLLKEVFSTRKFVNYNDSGYKAIQKILAEKYPEKSIFEE